MKAAKPTASSRTRTRTRAAPWLGSKRSRDTRSRRGVVEPRAQALAGGLLRLLRRRGQLDAAALAAASGVDLGLDDHRPAQLLGDLAGLLGAAGDPSSRDGYAELGHDLLGLVLVDLHGDSCITVSG